MFMVKKAVSSHTYKLELPRTMHIQAVFYVSLIDSGEDDPVRRQSAPPPPPVEVDGEEDYFVEEMLDSCIYRQRIQKLVKYTGYSQPSWKPN